jgi:tRNA uracil 4-sulfurtransferase
MKGISLLSDGIDSPVASYLMLKKNMELIFVNFRNSKSKEAEERVKRLVKTLAEKFNKELKLYFIDIENVQKEFMRNCNTRFQCLLCKRTMYKIAEKIAEKEKSDFLVSGENLGQVASQTLPNMYVLSKAVKIDVIRPLLCFEKNDSVKLAKEIGTYETSIENKAKCPFVPSNPSTRAKLEVIEREEKRVDMENLIKEAIDNSRIEIIKK